MKLLAILPIVIVIMLPLITALYERDLKKAIVFYSIVGLFGWFLWGIIYLATN